MCRIGKERNWDPGNCSVVPADKCLAILLAYLQITLCQVEIILYDEQKSICDDEIRW